MSAYQQPSAVAKPSASILSSKDKWERLTVRTRERRRVGVLSKWNQVEGGQIAFFPCFNHPWQLTLSRVMVIFTRHEVVAAIGVQFLSFPFFSTLKRAVIIEENSWAVSTLLGKILHWFTSSFHKSLPIRTRCRLTWESSLLVPSLWRRGSRTVGWPSVGPRSRAWI